MPIREVRVDMTTGQIDARALARSDTKLYSTGLKEATNLMPLMQGGVRTRPKLVEVLTPNLLDGSMIKRLLYWRFDDDERFAIGLSNTALYIYRVINTAPFMTEQASATLVPIWVAATDKMLAEINFTYFGERAIICHKDLRPIQISRVGENQFFISQFKFGFWGGTGFQSQEPTFRTTPQSIHVYYTDGAGNPIESVPEDGLALLYWTGTDPQTGLGYDGSNLAVGSTVRIHNRPCVVTTAGIHPEVQAVRDLPRTYRLFVKYDEAGTTDKSRDWVDYETVICEKTNGEGVVVAREYDEQAADPFSLLVIVEKGNLLETDLILVGAESGTRCTTTAVAVPVVNRPTPWWEESMFSDSRGWFSAALFFQQRLWLAGSYEAPWVLCASRIQEYLNFDTGNGNDTEAIIVAIASNKVGQILKLAAARHMVIFTDATEHYIGEDEGNLITPKTVSVRSASTFGVGTASPIFFGGNLLMSDRSNCQLRLVAWNDINQGYSAQPLSFYHEDLLVSIKEIAASYAFENAASEYYFVLNDAGVLLLIEAIEALKVAGFWPWTFSNPVKSFFVDTAAGFSRLFLVHTTGIARLDAALASESAATLKTTQLMVKSQEEGESRGRNLHLMKFEIEGKLTAATVNGRSMSIVDVGGAATPARYEMWNSSWSKKPQITVTIPANAGGEIYNIIQEVGL